MWPIIMTLKREKHFNYPMSDLSEAKPPPMQPPSPMHKTRTSQQLARPTSTQRQRGSSCPQTLRSHCPGIRLHYQTLPQTQLRAQIHLHFHYQNPPQIQIHSHYQTLPLIQIQTPTPPPQSTPPQSTKHPSQTPWATHQPAQPTTPKAHSAPQGPGPWSYYP